MAGIQMFRALRHPNYRLFFAGQAVSLIGTWMQTIAQSWLVYDLTHSSLWLGLIGFIAAAPVLFFSLVGGAVADRFPKRNLILGLQCLLLLLALTLGILTAAGSVKIWHIAVLASLAGLVSAFEMPARQAFVFDMVGKDDLSNAIALNAALFNSARLIGPAIAGILIDSMGTAVCFLINSATFVAAIVALLLMKLPPFQPRLITTSVLRSTWEGLQYLRQTTDVRAVVILVGTMTIFGWSYSVLMPVFADEILGRGARGLGFLVSCNGLGALTAGLTLAVLGDTMRPSRLAFAGIGIFCVSVSALALSRVYWFSAACMVLVGFGLVIFLATSNATLQRRVSDGMRGRIMGIYSFVFNGFFPLGSLVAGFLAHRWNAPFAVLFGAGVCALTALLLARQVSPRSATMDSLKSD